ncbi:V-type proton ATPase subunit E, partial [Termitomyces sp. T112]
LGQLPFEALLSLFLESPSTLKSLSTTMSNRALNDEEVLQQMNKMVTFIKQEAFEKAREITVKADEEFAIEKAKLVKQEQQAIDAQYEKKRKGAEVSQRIAQSTLTNKSRLKLLHRREEHLQDLFSTSRAAVVQLAKDEGRYVQFLEGVIIQGFLQILEPTATVYARPQDVEIVKQAAANAQKSYTEISGRKVECEVEGVLSDDAAGGVKLVSGSRRITLDNTLDERLRLLEDRMLPEIRKDLFGVNENRKFYT